MVTIKTLLPGKKKQKKNTLRKVTTLMKRLYAIYNTNILHHKTLHQKVPLFYPNTEVL